MPVLIGGCAVAMVSFADTSVLSRAYAARTGTAVDPNQEMVGLGAANLAAGFFQGFPISSSSSRTPVAEAAGARTQLTGVVGALAVALLLVVAPDLLENLPSTALAAVVIASAIGLFEVNDLRRIYRIQRWEFWLSIVCFVGVAVFGAIPGIGIAIVIAVIEFLWDGWRPHSAILGRPEGVSGYHDLKRYPDARQIPGLVLFRWDAPLFFANAEFFRERVLDAIARAPTPVRWLVVAAEPVTSVDVTAADALAELDRRPRRGGHRLAVCRTQGSGQGQAQAVRAFRRDRRGSVLSDHRRGGAQLPPPPIGWNGTITRRQEHDEPLAWHRAIAVGGSIAPYRSRSARASRWHSSSHRCSSWPVSYSAPRQWTSCFRLGLS